MTKSPADFIFGVWNTPEVPIRIEYPLEVMEELRAIVSDELRPPSAATTDPAGALFGISRGPAVRILAWRPISRAASEEDNSRALLHDRAQMIRVLSSAATDPAMQGMEPLGWFVSRGQAAAGLTAHEIELFNHFFPNSWQVTLLLRRGPGGTARAGYFVREANGFLRTDASYRELLIQPVRRVPGAPEPTGAWPEIPKLQDVPIPQTEPQFEPERVSKSPAIVQPPPVEAAAEVVPAHPTIARSAEAPSIPLVPSRQESPPQQRQQEVAEPAEPQISAPPAAVEIPRKRARIPAIFEISSPEKRADTAKKPLAEPQSAPSARAPELVPEPPQPKELPRARMTAITEPASAAGEKRIDSAPRPPASTPATVAAPLAKADAKRPSMTVGQQRVPSVQTGAPVTPAREVHTSPAADELPDLVPSFGIQTHSFGGSRLLWVLPILLVLGVAIFLLMQKTAQTPVQSFSLRVASDGDNVEISWDPDSIPVRDAQRGSIEIQDGHAKKNLPLTTEQLHAGKTTYSRETGDVALEMNLFGGDGREFHEFARLVAQPVPSPNPTPMDRGEMPSQRDDLQSQVDELKQQVRKEAARADQAQGVVRILQNRLRVDESRKRPAGEENNSSHR